MAESRQAVVLVTGASAGVGLALSKELLRAPQSYRLVLTARSSSLPRFDDAGIQASDRVWLRPLDVTLASDREQLVDEIQRRWGGVDILVNNAGVAYRAVCEHVTEEDWIRQMKVNHLGPMELIRLVLPAMRERRSGRILNVSSVSGMMAMPTMSPYSASKFALEGATEALWYEVRPFGIHVTLVQPGFIHSASFRNTRYTALSQASMATGNDPYRYHYQHMAGFIARFMERTQATPEDVAKRILHAMQSPRPPLRMAATIDAHLFAWVRRLLPRRLYHKALYLFLPGIHEWGLAFGKAPPIHPPNGE